MKYSFKGKKVLITGGYGFIGIHLLQRLLQMDCQISIIDKNSKGLNGIYEYIGNLNDKSFIKKTMDEINPNIVFHLAADKTRSVKIEEFHKSLENNFETSLNLIEILKDIKNLDSFIYIDTVEAYGDNTTPFNEDMREKAISCYSFSKTCVVKLLEFMYKIYNFPMIVLRPSVCYGPLQKTDMFISSLIVSLIQNNEFSMTEGRQLRDFIYIDDLIDALILASIRTEAIGNIINIGSGRSVFLYQITDTVENYLGKKGLVKKGALQYRSGEIMNYSIDISKAKKILKWTPKTGLQEGLKKTSDFYLNQLGKMNLHYHSDCHIFGGCENMIVNFINDSELNNKFNISFSYRYSKPYYDGLVKKIENNSNKFYPIKLLNVGSLHSIFRFIPFRILRFFPNIILIIPHYLGILINTIILIKLFKKLNIQILHINNGGYPGAYSCLSAVLAAKFLKITNVVYVVNNYAKPYNNLFRLLDYPLDRLVKKQVRYFVTGSKAAGIRLNKVLKLSYDQLINIHNGIKPRKVTESKDQFLKNLNFQLSDNRKIIGMVAVFDKRKGHMVLIKAMGLLKKKFKDVPVLMIEGEGGIKSELKKYVDDKNLSDCIYFIGVQNNIFNFINSIDILILPSISNEDFPNIILEAMSMGKIVIASKIAGIPEQIEDGLDGLLVEPSDEVMLAEKIELIMNNSKLSDQLAQRAKDKFSKQFSSEKAVKKYLDLYNLLISGTVY